MERFTSIFTLFALLISFSLAQAQGLSIGLRTGATYYILHNEEISEEAKYSMGVNVAIPVEISLSPIFSIQPELHFIQKGVQFKDVLDGQVQTIDVKTNYLELPLLFKASFGGERLGFYTFAGPSIGYATNRFVSEKLGRQDRVREEVDFIEGETASSRRWDISATVGLGGRIEADVGSLVLDVRYSLGFSDNTQFTDDKPENWNKTTNRGCTVSVGYMLPIGL